MRLLGVHLTQFMNVSVARTEARNNLPSLGDGVLGGGTVGSGGLRTSMEAAVSDLKGCFGLRRCN